MVNATVYDFYLMERQCLKIPDFFSDLIEKYAKNVYELMHQGWAKENIEFVIICYSRLILPHYCTNCVVADLFYLEFLGDIEHWRRLKNNRLLESIFFKYLKNISLFYGNFERATFYEWSIKNKQYIVPTFTPDDCEIAFSVNLVALMHECAHFIKGYEEFDALFEEYIKSDNWIKKRSVKEIDTLKREAKCDYMGLLILMEYGNSLYQTKEQMLEMYFRMIAGNCFYKFFENFYKDSLNDFRFQDFTDRSIVTVKFFCGLKDIFPDIDTKKVSTEMLKDILDGLQHIRFFLKKIGILAKEYNTLAESYKVSLYQTLQAEERELKNGKYILYPRSA